MILKSTLFTLLFIVSINSLAFDRIPDRRKEQNPTVPAYFLVPLPYSKPGIGDGLLLLANVANVGGSTADLNFIQVTGDAGGRFLHGEEVPLISDWLSLEFNYQDITRANVNNYSIRGMNGTDKDDFNIIEVGYAKQLDTTFIFSFYDKRLNFYYARNDGDYRLDAIKDSNGNLIETLNYETSNQQDSFSVEFDITDDYLDPRNGLRFGVTYQDHAADNADDVDYYTVDFKAMAYIPMRRNDTLVLDFRRSDAHVNNRGNTDPAAIRAELTTNCTPADSACLQAEQELVDSFIDARTYGTATNLGGDLRLRAYPGERFQGAHSVFLGAEYRWNITEESTPFDYLIWKDVRTGIQAAFFAEVGTVSEVSADLWQKVRYSVGAGMRLITGSGGVYRADIATGDEGVELIIIFDYPWY